MNPEVSNDEIAKAVVDLMSQRGYRPLTLRAILHQLKLHRGERLRLRNVLQRLVSDGKVLRTASKRFALLTPTPQPEDVVSMPAPRVPARRARDMEPPPRTGARPARTGRADRSERGGFLVPLSGGMRRTHRDTPAAHEEVRGEREAPPGTSTKSATWVPGSGNPGRVTGRVSFTREGYGFLVPDPPYKGDLFVPARERLGACHKDRVEAVVLTGRDGRSYARVLKVLERHFQTVVGLYEKGALGGRVVPSRDRNLREIRVMPGDHGGARSGDLVEVDIMQFPTSHQADLIGRVTTVFGRLDDPKIDLKVIAREFEIPLEFPPAVELYAKKVGKIEPHDLAARTDLRKDMIFTIDGEDARDFDDAISLKLLPGGKYQLGVHIADVSHYVTEGSILDVEARTRATSVYFPEAAVPMLPEVLSNGMCSLVPHEDRLTLTCSMVFSKTGERMSYEIFPSVINSVHRLTYGKVERMLVGDDRELRVEYEDAYPTLVRMAGLARVLKKQRVERGSLDFALTEAKVILDDTGRVKEIKALGDPVARNLIEEFMVAANEALASFAKDRKVPMVFRIHEIPDPEKIFALATLAESLEIGWQVEDPGDPHELQQLLELIDKHPHGNFLRTLMLRSMKQARYHPVNSGHFGLGSSGYTHFTSPIRRYPDLMVHRLAKHVLKASEMTHGQYEKLVEDLEERSVHCSEKERVAQNAERAGVALKMARYMEDKVGKTFKARISGVASYGMFVTLEGSLVEGMIATRDLPRDNYRYSETGFSLTGEFTGKVYRLGGELVVRCASVDILARQVNFVIAPPEGKPGVFEPAPRPSAARPPRRDGPPSRGGARRAGFLKGDLRREEPPARPSRLGGSREESPASRGHSGSRGRSRAGTDDAPDETGGRGRGRATPGKRSGGKSGPKKDPKPRNRRN